MNIISSQIFNFGYLSSGRFMFTWGKMSRSVVIFRSPKRVREQNRLGNTGLYVLDFLVTYRLLVMQLHIRTGIFAVYWINIWLYKSIQLPIRSYGVRTDNQRFNDYCSAFNTAALNFRQNIIITKQPSLYYANNNTLGFNSHPMHFNVIT